MCSSDLGLCKLQTIALPYFVQHELLPARTLEKHEDKCLEYLEWKLFVAVLKGRKIKVLLMELLLAGNGGELSHRFLVKLAKLLKTFGVGLIIDEVMTGGRVGPDSMAFTSTLPDEVIERVKYLTMGKIFNCGLVLERAHKKPTMRVKARGESTDLVSGEAFMRWKKIQEFIDAGMIKKRRSEVLKLMTDRGKNEVENWGRGCLIFTGRARPEVHKNIKCRLLPKLENLQLTRLHLKDSTYTRGKVCRLLFESADQWILAGRRFEVLDQSPFFEPIMDYVVAYKPNVISSKAIMEVMGTDLANSKAEECWRSKRCKNVVVGFGCAISYKKQPKTYINEVLLELSKRFPRVVYLTRKGRNRQQGYAFNYNLFYEQATQELY